MTRDKQRRQSTMTYGDEIITTEANKDAADNARDYYNGLFDRVKGAATREELDHLYEEAQDEFCGEVPEDLFYAIEDRRDEIESGEETLAKEVYG